MISDDLPLQRALREVAALTDLSDFGVDVDDADQDTTDDSSTSGTGYGASHQYRRGRCRAISTSTIVHRRCRSPISNGSYCAVHGREERSPTSRPVSIDDDPVELIRWMSPKSGRCQAIQRNGERCSNGCRPLERFCALHQGGDFEIVDELEPDELDVDLIRNAIAAVGGEVS